MQLTWNSTVSREQAIDLLSTNQRLIKGQWTLGTNASEVVERMTRGQIEAHKHGAWMTNEMEKYVAYSSLLGA
jgi:hypothetical protein